MNTPADVTDSPATLMVIDDHPLLRRGVRQLLEVEDDLTLVSDTGSPHEGLAQALEQEPDMLLLDLNMPDLDGLALLSRLRAGGYAGRIIMYTVSDQEDNVVDALRNGADGYLLKDMPPDRLLEALERQGDGEMLFDPRLTALMAGALRRRPTVSGPTLDHLTRREREILRLLAKSYANKQIAQHLAIREGTVKVHMRHLLKKLEMHSRTEAAVWAAQQELG